MNCTPQAAVGGGGIVHLHRQKKELNWQNNHHMTYEVLRAVFFPVFETDETFADQHIIVGVEWELDIVFLSDYKVYVHENTHVVVHIMPFMERIALMPPHCCREL